jgi:hypothetical protein
MQMATKRPAITAGASAVRGTLFADPSHFRLWFTLYEELRQEVICVSPGRWLALPIDVPWSEIRWRMMTGQGHHCPVTAASEALAWSSPIDHSRKERTQAEIYKRRKDYEESQPMLFDD